MKKAEHWRIDAWTVVLEKTLESPLGSKEIQPIHPKGTSPEYSLEGLMLKLKRQYFGHLMQKLLIWKDPDAGNDWRQEGKGTTEDEMVGWHHWLNRCEFEQTSAVGDGQGGLASWSPLDTNEQVRHDWATELNWTRSHDVVPAYLSKLWPATLLLLCPNHTGLFSDLRHRVFPTAHSLCAGCSFYLEKLTPQIFILLAPSLPQVSAQMPPPR